MKSTTSCLILLLSIFSAFAANLNSQQTLEEAEKFTLENENFLQPPHCGIAKKNTRRILGGVKTLRFELPWMVFFSMGCGGTIINSRWILTAAHCFHTTSLPQYIIDNSYGYINAHECNSTNYKAYCDRDAIEVELGKKIIHDQYDSRQFYNDIALIQTKDKMQLGETIRAICLPYNNEVTDHIVHRTAHVSGWGLTERGVPSESLLKTNVDIWPGDQCEEFKGISRHVMKSKLQICAGGIDRVDSCSGDSGGPLYMHLTDTFGENNLSVPLYQIGVVSFGPNPCGIEGKPGVYTNVANYIPWIKQTILSN